MHAHFLKKNRKHIRASKKPTNANHTFHFRVCGDIKRRYKYGKNRGNPNEFKQKRKIWNSDWAKFTVPKPTAYHMKKTYNLQNHYLQPKGWSSTTHAHQWRNIWTCSVARYRVPTSSFRRFSHDLVGTSYRALEFGSIINCPQTYHRFYYDRDECRNYTPCSRIWFDNLQKKNLQSTNQHLQSTRPCSKVFIIYKLKREMWNLSILWMRIGIVWPIK